MTEFVHADDLERWMRERLRALDGRPDDEVTDVEGPDGHLKTVAEARFDFQRGLTRLVVERWRRESG